MIKSNNSIKKISYIYLISLLPLIIFGFYKNGISLYSKNLISKIYIFKPLFIIIIGCLIGVLVNIIYEKIIRKNNIKLIDIIFSSFHPLYGILIGCISSINTNLLLFTVITFIVLFISKFLSLKINYIAFTSLIIFFIMTIFNKFTFLNIYESSSNFNMNAIDYLFGKGSGGIFTTNIILLVISFIILYNNSFYKKDIPIIATITFSILTIIYCLINNSIGNILDMLFTNGILFSFVYIATDSISSSYTKKGIVIYSILIGLITFILYLINPALSSLGSCFLVSIFNSLIDIKFE